MSKSLGNVVNPFFALERFDVDPLRFYMVHDGGLKDDAAYENSYIVDRFRKSLSGGLGNLASRVTRSPVWSMRAAVAASQTNPSKLTSGADKPLRDALRDLPDVVSHEFSKLDPGAALKSIMNVVYSVSLSVL